MLYFAPVEAIGTTVDAGLSCFKIERFNGLLIYHAVFTLKTRSLQIDPFLHSGKTIEYIALHEKMRWSYVLRMVPRQIKFVSIEPYLDELTITERSVRHNLDIGHGCCDALLRLNVFHCEWLIHYSS